MAASTSASSANYLFTQSLSRKLLFHSPLLAPPAAIPPSRIPTKPVDNSFDANVVMVLSVLLCALICSLGLNSIIRCALRCSSLISPDDQNLSARLTNTGIKKKALKMFLTVNYTAELNLPGFHTECAICLSEFGQGEKVRVLPKCSHAFHVRCIDKWLNSHSSCPTCRHCLIETGQTVKKVADCGSQAIPAQESLHAQETLPAQGSVVIRIAPLEHEGVVRSHHSLG